MTLDTTQQRFGPQISFDYPAGSQAPAFSNPWSSATPSQAQGAAGLYVGNQHHAPAPSHAHLPQPSALSASMLANKAHQPLQGTRQPSVAGPPSASLTPYGSLPAGPSSAGKFQCRTLTRKTRSRKILTSQISDLMSISRMGTTSTGYGEPSYASSASPVHGQFASSSAPGYDAMGYAPAPVRQPAFSMGAEADPTRRFSHS